MEKQEEPRVELISAKEEERKIPVFTVLKNNAILKNIFLLDNPAFSEESEKELEEILVVGRHPECNITLEHPSISRFHLRIHSNPSSQSLSVIDLSSVHGTWIAGKRIEPGVRVKLQEGDTMQLGGSSRVYRLHWIPSSRAYDLEIPFLPTIMESEPVKEGEGERNQDEDGFSHDDSLTKRDELEGLDSLHSDTDVYSAAPPLPEDIYSAVAYEEKVECKTTNTGIHVEDKSNIGQPDYQLDEEDNMPQPSFAQKHSLAEFQTENAGSASLGSRQRPALNIWSRRGKASSVLIQTGRDAKKSSRVSFGSEINSENNADTYIQSFSNDLFQSGDMGEKVSTPDKENSPPSSLPLGSLKTTDELNLKSGSTMKSSLLNVDEVDEIVAPDKENVTMKVIQNGRDANNSPRVSFGSEIKSENNADTDIQSFSKDLFQIGDMGEKVFTPDRVHSSPSSQLLESLKTKDELDLKSGSTMESSPQNVDEVDEIEAPDKENVDEVDEIEAPDKENVDEVDEIEAPDKENVTMKVIQTGRDANKSSRASFGSEIKYENNADTDIQSFSKDLFQSGDMGEKMFTPDRENSPPSSLLLGSSFGSEIKSENNADTDIQSFSKDLFHSGDMGENIFTPDKDNSPPSSLPLGSLKMTYEFDLKSGSTMKTSPLNVDEVDEIVTPNKENITMSILCQSGGADEETFTPDKQMLTPNKENQTPTSVSLRSLFDTGSAMISSVGEDAKIVFPDKKNTTLVIPPLSRYVDEEEISPPDQGNLTPTSFPLGSLKNTDEFDLRNGLTMKSTLVDETVTPDKENITSNIHFLSGGMDEEEIFTPSKENCISSSVLEIDLKSQSTMKSSIPNMDEVDDENVTPNKENVALKTHLLRSIKQQGKLENILKKKVLNPSPLKNAVDPRIHNDEGMPFSLENDNCTEKVGECDGEICTPDKENMTPNTHFLWSMDKIGKPGETKKHTWKANEDDSLLSMNMVGKLEETFSRTVVNPHQYEGMSVEKESHYEKVLQEPISICAVSRNQEEKGLNVSLQSVSLTQKGKIDRQPLQSVSLSSKSSKTESNYSTQDVSTKSIHHIKYLGVEEEHIVREENKRWCMVVDTTSLLNKESRKALQLLQGLKRTCLIIPRIVIRELDCMKRRRGFFRRSTEVSSALEWVEDCMINTKWWIHVQSSEEEASAIPPTPPATPASLIGYDSFLNIVSPTAEDHILEYALSFRKTNNAQLVLLSDDVTLKIKSMAEGLLCETASDFRESLVNPFSERFLWADSSPRGTTWSSADDVVLKETYYRHRPKKPSRLGEAVCGLKLILLHNSHYKQFIH
ncbi:PREDICTED: FHA domain-containing protein PS1 isoform X2 [Ipomoea nil]|uniref:FHA domain-containing protein PS1 isoform X2 n=1 Tax=Ipomoea nil TaxID=35883 RepID=UPI0009018C09|nr:PREDICTED: FHA domain-containing protein PS1 isoform X2 [Ipomoea nil]